jgi:hypothetical protein
VGNQASVSGKYLRFWKGKYFIQLESYEIASPIREGMIELAKATSKHIKDPPTPPDLLTRLPSKNRVLNSEKYFFSDYALKRIYHFVPENILKLGEKTPGVSGAYFHEPSSTNWVEAMIAFVIRYDDESGAKAADESYRSYLQASAIVVDSSQTGIVARERK